MDTKENKTIKFIIIAVLIIAAISLIGFAFARYITRLNGTTQAPIARWNFRVTAGSSENLQIDLADTRYVNDTTEVDRTKVAPGTKGAIQLNVDGSGSQVSLQYNIDLTLTQIPENLIFYEDEEMTTALLKENGKIHLDGYFGVNDVNKTATKNLYWQWKLETGTTQAEIDSNDLLDSAWIGERITLGIEATGKQVVDNPATKYAVTFDLNGGKLEDHGDSEQITKQVTYGDVYGDLPIPTRTGYSFVGWTNGINIPGKTGQAWATILANASNLKPNTRYNVEYDLSIDESVPEEYEIYGLNQWGDIRLQVNGEYTIHKQAFRMVCGGVYDAGEVFHIKTVLNTLNDISNGRLIYYTGRVVKSNDQSQARILNGTFSNIYFYEDDVLMKNVTENTEVIINKNHTLTAIWEPASNNS